MYKKENEKKNNKKNDTCAFKWKTSLIALQKISSIAFYWIKICLHFYVIYTNINNIR